ncbi:zinc-dependent alcohol dehydrogenase family protein [Chryseolinea lacunae]|uniref:Zinc-dependent alcohol dehydrogenase family protein n=1 Tax=Chryseolinea lacunae TaxID=2801331 RepID=A0ABS1KR59_9BACT|nr:zinc-dependent alcohol dehydrogenase family protein [Chryseolinea lacunae]MBL0741955.1 zinc-dependent alcohol dehydrogenase family protein [Chryseolinea lacunae]
MNTSHKTMRALVLEVYNSPLTMHTVQKPVPAKGEVLVRIKAAGLNPLDLKIMAGQAGHAQTKLPATLGIDMAGVVEDVGDGVASFKAGDKVFGMVGGVGGMQGTLADYASVDAELLAHKPVNLSMKEAAALPLVLITAWEGLVDRAGVHEGETVLVHGGAGGVGHVAVQLARAKGAQVFATGSASNMNYLRALGAQPVDYISEKQEQYLAQYTNDEGFDVVFDTVGGATLDASFTAVKLYKGRVVSALGWGTHSLAPLSFRSATYSGIFTLYPLISGKQRAHHGHILKQATALIEAGKIVPLVDERHYDLETAANAYATMANRTAKGKVVIEL